MGVVTREVHDVTTTHERIREPEPVPVLQAPRDPAADYQTFRSLRLSSVTECHGSRAVMLLPTRRRR
jgi:hypothetical protein